MRDLIYSPVNEGSKMGNRKKKSCSFEFGRIVEGNVLNNMLKVPACRRWVLTKSVQKEIILISQLSMKNADANIK